MNGRYLYCIVKGNESVNFGRIGIEGSSVYTVPYKDVSAVVHNCHAELYHSENDEILKAWIRTHQRVVDIAWETFGIVLPFGFDTIIMGDDLTSPQENVKNCLKQDYDSFKRKIRKVGNKAEYGVQIFWHSEVMAQKLAEESIEINRLNSKIKSKPRGLAYMYRQKLEGILRKEMGNKADRYFKEFYKKIKPYVDDLRVEKTKKTEDKDKQMFMNLSCLLTKDESRKLGDELEKIDAIKGFSVRYTGPWPPYSFV